MNLSWLKRIEKRFIENDSQFCGCFDDFVNQMIDGVYNGVPYETDDSGLPKGFCEKCQKPCDVEMLENFTCRMDLILPAFAVEKVSESAVIEALLPLGAARLLQMPLSDVNRHIRSGRLSLDASGRFVTQDSLDALQRLIRSKS